MSLIDTIELLGHRYPELAAMVAGSALSWAPGLILETWVLPVTWPDRKVKQVTLGVTVAVATTVSALLWHWFAPLDKKGLVWLVSGAAALSAPVIHLFAAKILTHFFPYLDSVFKFKSAQSKDPP
jgi:hypothetical protein